MILFTKITRYIFVGLMLFLGFKSIFGVTDVLVVNKKSDNSKEDTNEKDEIALNEPFIPTNEWQVIKPGQSIPAGLHVRMNFETGIKEAKIIEKEEKVVNKRGESSGEHASPKIILGDNIKEFPTSDEKIYFTKSELKGKLKNLRDKVGTKDIINNIVWSEEAKDALNAAEKDSKLKFRSIEEIRADLEQSFNWNVKSDLQIMQESIKLLQNLSLSVDEKVAALDNLEYYAHQIDNGRDLEKVGGLEIVVQLLNQSTEQLLQKAASVVGAAAQSNSEVQNAVINHGGLVFLLRLINDNQPLTRKKALYALSAVVRGNSHVLEKLIELGGLKLILNIAKDHNAGALRVKAVSLLYDLIVEQQEAIQDSKIHRSPFFESLIKNGWCHILIPLLKIEDYDTKEKVMQSIEISVKECKKEWIDDQTLSILDEISRSLKKDYELEEDADLKNYIADLRTILNEKIIKPLKEVEI
ncbi:nucleotide exchange factor SIL1 isoform X2 [Hydra vulgaris]|uniref:Nucleotide exchange factor SIL1 n=1 Tax=Hydra vulgaris TaxID=6087 RepID=A0ABM4BJJ9_HYDVU